MTKASNPSSISFPPAFASSGEQHPFLAKYKRTLEKRLSLTRMETLFEEVDLATYLLALGRTDEALEVASFLPAQISFSGNHNVWSPVGLAITTTTHLLRLAGNLDGARVQLSKLLEHPSHADREAEFYVEDLAKRIPAQMEQGWEDASIKWACQVLARAVAKAIYWRETNVKGFHHQGFYSNEAADKCRALGLERLRTRMDGRASGAG